MRRYTYALIIIAAVGIIVAGAVLVIYNIRRANTNEKSEVIEYENGINITENIVIERTSIETNFEENKITPSTLILYNKYYKGCGHTVKERDAATDTMVNLTEEQLKGLYSDWEIQKFTNDEVVLYKEFEGQCGEHYLLRDDEGLLNIYKIESDGSLKLIEETEISTQYLPAVDVSKLKEGVKLNGKEELNSYVEDFE